MEIGLTTFFDEHKTFSTEEELRDHLSFYNPTMLASVSPQLAKYGYKTEGYGRHINLVPIIKTESGESCVSLKM
jgi:hypothetical protein